MRQGNKHFRFGLCTFCIVSLWATTFGFTLLGPQRFIFGSVWTTTFCFSFFGYDVLTLFYLSHNFQLLFAWVVTDGFCFVWATTFHFLFCLGHNVLLLLWLQHQVIRLVCSVLIVGLPVTVHVLKLCRTCRNVYTVVV